MPYTNRVLVSADHLGIRVDQDGIVPSIWSSRAEMSADLVGAQKPLSWLARYGEGC